VTRAKGKMKGDADIFFQPLTASAVFLQSHNELPIYKKIY
jgi:hypothetical protein